MSSAKIITTIGPSSLNPDILKYFKEHSVEYARLNFSHVTSQWHIEAAKICRSVGLKILMDLGGPKIRLGVLEAQVEAKIGAEVVLEYFQENLKYPYILPSGEVVLPVAIDISPALEKYKLVLIDDGKICLKVKKIQNQKVFCQVETGGNIKSQKGVNLPKSTLQISFLTSRDKTMMSESLAQIMPEVVACSFVKNKKDIEEMKDFLSKVIREQNIKADYFPKICTKIEQNEVFLDHNLEEIVQSSDIIMIARGDLALEFVPIHLSLPFLQEKIVQVCKKYNKPFVIATQILESMIDSPVPTRAEVSDLYRAVMLDKADFIMLSGESAMGKYPTQCVKLMNDMIEQGEGLQEEIF